MGATEGDSLDLEPLIVALRGVRGASGLYLQQGMDAMETAGAAGEIRIHIPGKPGDRLEVEWWGRPEQRR